jgi:uracil-DNA glycosylase family 4
VADRVADLQELDAEVRACTRCDLHLTASRGVPGEGRVDATIMLVGEAPGRTEDSTGRPFVGAAGRFLDELLGLAGLKRDEVYITNVVKHRPPENRDPNAEEIEACLPYLFRQVEIIRPRLIVTLGRFALQTFFPEGRMMRDHGQLRQRNGRYFFPILHPAAALHQERNRPLLVEDMQKLGEILRGPIGQQEGQVAEPEGEDPPEQLTLL